MNAKSSFFAITLVFCLEIHGAPRPADSRYEISVFADAPDIVTPIGAAVDSRGRLFVIESHTLTPPEDYAGPEDDRIKVFEDADLDGKPDTISVFADGFTSALRLAFGPDDSLYVGCSKSIWRIEDRDGDGRADWRKEIITIETDDPFPWGHLDGITFSADGDLYFNRGFMVFPHRTIGRDDSVVAGYVEGGAILRCRPDGSGLERFASGFWAAPALAFDTQGRLLAVDNDPLSTGPNRLIHCVEGGDYGFRIRYGFGGHSPLVDISGELAGTLPSIHPTGESPSDLLICAGNRFPEDMANTVLVSLWGDHAIERHDLEPSGATLKSNRSIWLQGETDFRPVDMAVALDGIIYVTDWVQNDYRNHGQGRIWRIAPRSGTTLKAPRKPGITQQLKEPETLTDIRNALRGEEPFVRHAACRTLTKPEWVRSIEVLSFILQCPLV